ncbi:MAG: DUF1566 domain-containing protein [Chromatiales bacterium]|jgi:hypothetical protein|nr:DUF1566 domain-containing protein [Chromatiales bacterium]MDX9768495.1 DUF1566 domain-containing protein [Ectothiorhodospiraceae bacterium]
MGFDGHFSVWVAGEPPYRVTVSGGTLGGAPYPGVLEAWCESTACDVTPWTTVVVGLMDAYGFNAGDARAMLAAAAGFDYDPFVRLAQGGSVPTHAFDPSIVRQALDNGAGLSAWVNGLIAWIVAGACPIPANLGLPYPPRCGDPPAQAPPVDARPPEARPAADEATCADGTVVSGATTPTAEFELHRDGSATHTRTGLIWDRCLLGQASSDVPKCSGEPLLFTLPELQNLLLGGPSGDGKSYRGARYWQIPTRDQLATLVERRCSMPAVNAAVFPDASPSQMLWTSSTDGFKAAWSQSVGTGEMILVDQTTNKLAVRLVRRAGSETATRSGPDAKR